MSDLHKNLAAYREEGREKFEAISAAGSAVRNFADAKRENSAENYDIDRINEAAVSTIEASVEQSAAVYKMFAHRSKEE